MLNKQFISILKKSLVPLKWINWEAIWPFLSFLIKIFHITFYYFSIFIEIHWSSLLLISIGHLFHVSKNPKYFVELFFLTQKEKKK